MAAVAALGLFGFAPAASAEVLTATVPAVSGDQASAGRDITRLSVRYDTAGHIAATVSLRGAPAAGDPTQLIVHVGTISGDNCGAPAAIVGGPLGAGTAQWALSDGASGAATRGGSGATVTFDARAAALAALPYRCVWAQVNDGTDRLDMTDGWASLSAPAPLPPVETPVPTPTPTPAPPQPPPPPPALSVGGVAKAVQRGRWTRVRVAVRNPGGTAASRVRLTAGRVRGAAVKPRSARWPRLRAGGVAYAKLRVKLTRRSRVRIPLRATAAGGLRDSAAVRLSVKRRRTKPRNPPATGTLAGRHFWGSVYHVDWAWDNRGVYFVDGRWAYQGLPRGGLPRCTAVTQTVDEDGEPTGDGCRRYTFDRRSGRVTVGDLKGTFRKGKLVLDDVEMSELTTPTAGTRLEVNLDHRGYRGLCGLILGCTTWHEELVLFRDGQFVRSRSSVSTIGGGGVPFTAIASYPPDQRGRYAVLSRGRMRLAYADGTVAVETIGIERDARGRPDPAKVGLLLDDTNFYVEDDDD